MSINKKMSDKIICCEFVLNSFAINFSLETYYYIIILNVKYF